MHECLVVERSGPLHGDAQLFGAKNAVLVIMMSLILTDGVSQLHNVPASEDVLEMIKLLEQLGAQVTFLADDHLLIVDTRGITKWKVNPEIMKKMRASVLVLGPLLARFGRAEIAMPGGDMIGSRPIDYHLKNFEKMGVAIAMSHEVLSLSCDKLTARRLVLEYPSVGATENLLMAATLTAGTTHIINAALEPEVYDLIAILQKMGADITVTQPATLIVRGVNTLKAVEHTIIPDRLEAGSLLIATAITGGEILLPYARADHLDLVLFKLDEMGHAITVGADNSSIHLKASKSPKAVSIKTAPFPGFPTDLQAPMMAAQCVADGISVIDETVFENRFLHVAELQKMGAHIKVNNTKATIIGVDQLYGASVIASDIRASCALVIAGMVAEGTTIIAGVQHWRRGYDALEKKLARLGAMIDIKIIQQADGVIKSADHSSSIHR